MEKQTLLNFFIPFAVIASVFSGPVYNFLIFFQTNILESHWSIYIDDIMFANLMAVTIILFALTFLISLKFQDKIAKETIIIIAMIINGYSCIMAGLIWTMEITILVFFLTGITTAYLIPALAKLSSDKVSRENKGKRYKRILPLSALFWIFLSFVLFIYFGASSWRMLYFITGAINILSSLSFIFI